MGLSFSYSKGRVGVLDIGMFDKKHLQTLAFGCLIAVALVSVNVHLYGGDLAFAQAGEDPIIILWGTDPQHVKLGDGYVEQGALANDNQDGNLTGSIVIDTDDFVDAVGSYTIYYDVTDSDTNTYQETRTVNVKNANNTLPVINLFDSSTINIPIGSGYNELGASANDTEDGNLTGSIFIDSSEFVDELGSYTITYNVTDSDYNLVEEFRTVNVVVGSVTLTTTPPTTIPTTPEPFVSTYVRQETTETTMTSAVSGITRMGLPQHVLDNQGDWVANLINEDSNGVQVESGSTTYWFSKSSCSLTQYENGRINEASYIVIKSNSWVVKVAQNGTDNWSDVSQNNLACTVTTEQIGDHFILNSTKSDSNGTISEIYDYKKYGDLKQTVYFTNNDSSLNDHKFSFSNILQDTPKSFLIDAIIDGDLTSNMYSIYSPESQPAFFGGQATVINFANGDVIEFDRDMLFDNGTAVLSSFTWFDEQVGFAGYGFQTAIDQLWAIKFLPQSDQTMDIYIDYANVDTPLAVGGTIEIDPIEVFPNWSYQRIRSSETASSGNCNDGDTTGVDVTLQARISTASASQESCYVPFFLFDITVIPDEATALVTHFQWNVTSNTNSAFGFFTGGGSVVSVLNDNIFALTADQISDVLFRNDPAGVKGDAHFSVGSTFRQGGTYVGIKSDTNSLPTDTSNIQFTEQLASGRNFYQLAIGGFSFSTTFASGSSNANFVTQGTYLQVEWEILSPAEAPFNITLGYTDSPDSCDLDWEAPSDLGGATAILGYQIKRNTGGLDQILVADTGNALPTSYEDDTIIGGIAHRYAVAAITSIGVGNFSAPIDSNGDIFSPNSPEFNPAEDPAEQGLQVPCGIPENPSDPILDTLTNTALGVVGMDFRPPLFTGNSEITGYQIDRTSGTPQGVDNEFTFIQHERSGTAITFGTAGDLLDFDQAQGQEWRSPTGCPSCVRFTTSQVEGFSFGTWHSHTGIGHAYIFKEFPKESLSERNIFIKWVQHKIAAGYSLQTFGDWETRIMIVDGVYDMTQANLVGASGSFPANVAGAGSGDNVGLHLPAIGNGVIVDCLDTVNNTTILLGGNPVTTTLPSTSQMESAGHHEILCSVGDLSGASQDTVTFLFQLYDNQGSLIPCGSNCASSGSGSIVLDEINIQGLGEWEFQNDLPLDTLVTFVDNSATNGRDPSTQSIVGTAEVQAFVLGDGFVTIVADTGSDSTEFFDNTVSQLTLYGYRVLAINAIGVSPPSNIKSITTAGLPEIPATPNVVATGTQTINIDWGTPNLNQGALVGYEIERKLGVGGIFTTLESGIQETNFLDGEGLFSLVPATEYCYRVQVETGVGESGFSGEACAETFDAPSKVQNLQVTALDGSTTIMSFEAPVSNGGSVLEGYKIEQQISLGGFTVLEALTFDLSRNDTGLPIGSLIDYRVSASNQFGFGETVTASATTDSTPQAPPNFTCSASSSTSITLSWDTPITFSAPTGYLVDRAPVGDSFTTIEGNTASTDTMYLDDGLAVDSTFVYRILGHTTEGDTDFSVEITCATLSAPDSFPPENVRGEFTQTVPHQMVVAWDIPNTFGIPISSFRVERDDGAGYNEIASVSGNTPVYIDQDPDNAISQKYRVFTVGTLGDSPPAVVIPFSANQLSHWHYEKSISDTGVNKNTAMITGTANFTATGISGLGHTFDGSTYITVSDEEDYDRNINTPIGITTYYSGSSTGVTQALVTKANTFGAIGYSMFVDSTDVLGVRITNTATSNELHVLGSTPITDGSLHFLGFGYTVSENGSLATLFEDFVNCLDNQCGGLWTTNPNTDRIFVNTVDNQIDFIVQSDIDNDIIYYDLGSPIGSKYELQFKLYFDDINSGGSSEYLAFGITDSTSQPKTADHDSINYVLQQGVGTDHMALDYIDNNVIDQSGICDSDPYSFVTATNYYFEIEVDGTSLVGNFYLDNFSDEGGTLVHTQSCTISGTIDGLQYVYLSSVSAVQTNSMEGEALRINVYDGLFAQDQSLSLMVDGSFETKNVITDNLSSTILNDNELTIGGYDNGSNLLTGLLDDTRWFGSGTLDDATLQAIAEDSITTVIPINATFVISGATFADISSETPVIIMTSGYPLPIVNTIDLFNFTATNVNSQTPAILIDSATGIFTLDPTFFNVMTSLSNYTAIGSLTNSQETLDLFSNFDIQVPLFTFTGDFFYQQQRNPTFDFLSFNYTQTSLPFSIACNFKSTLFENGTTVVFNDVFFVQHIEPVNPFIDVVVACIDENSPPLDPSAPSFGGSNTILSFVSFGDTTGIGNFLQFTNNYGDFFGVGLPFLFVIILAAAFTGRSAPTGILIIAVAIGIMSALGILVVDPFMWGIILVLVILGVLGGKKFL